MSKFLSNLFTFHKKSVQNSDTRLYPNDSILIAESDSENEYVTIRKTTISSNKIKLFIDDDQKCHDKEMDISDKEMASFFLNFKQTQKVPQTICYQSRIKKSTIYQDINLNDNSQNQNFDEEYGLDSSQFMKFDDKWQRAQKFRNRHRSKIGNDDNQIYLHKGWVVPV
ncbi:hypothetical protein KAFR_0A03630 [Kazachstania africana CBS 2517]|uniref:Uncharacterized protein n=1 Tax=Kazachstania africana (strain ATCC 22294 / BCRC 22015 / CBS 2517 / CECT 1963 / NBRC 1671 / NRRL Y-8276) TaxID=1071382 RepID=H2AN48_KAZAF|nr:hypothetical protein KAFR_0A03630 [Kazachstania africana CBS 2517]CCF55798.1 hypothetical protein KAFR_0A03630 [Kazachstania africana CBS 2517]